MASENTLKFQDGNLVQAKTDLQMNWIGKVIGCDFSRRYDQYFVRFENGEEHLIKESQLWSYDGDMVSASDGVKSVNSQSEKRLSQMIIYQSDEVNKNDADSQDSLTLRRRTRQAENRENRSQVSQTARGRGRGRGRGRDRGLEIAPNNSPKPMQAPTLTNTFVVMFNKSPDTTITWTVVSGDLLNITTTKAYDRQNGKASSVWKTKRKEISMISPKLYDKNYIIII
jgi:hypothetical protein